MQIKTSNLKCRISSMKGTVRSQIEKKSKHRLIVKNIYVHLCALLSISVVQNHVRQEGHSEFHVSQC